MNTFYNMIEHSLCYEEGDIHPKYITMWETHYAFKTILQNVSCSLKD